LPAGEAEFDGQLVDVIVAGLAIERRQGARVTKVLGGRIFVRAIAA
jgi:hypothetical protein